MKQTIQGTKLIALDIDGTIIDRPKGVPVHKKVRVAVREARDAGAKVCLCSARPCYYMQDATEGLDEVDALIGCSGATVKVDGKYIYKLAIPREQLHACFETAKRLDMYMSFAGDEKIYVSKKGPVYPPLENGKVFVILEDEEMLKVLNTLELYCAFVFTRPGVTKKAVFTDPVFASASIHKSSSNSFNLTNGDANKGTGVLKVAELWSIPKENILAVGNDENDIPMFEAAGTGVAVANAGKDVKDASDWVAPGVRQGGAAEAIRRFAL